MTHLEKVRKLMQAQGIDAYIITKLDPHVSEYPHPSYNEVAFVSGFEGSNATAVVTKDKAYVWTDNRYYLQAEKELTTGWEMQKMEPGHVDYISFAAEAAKGGTLAFDGKTLTTASVGLLNRKKTPESAIKHDVNLVAQVWEDKPVMTREHIWQYPLKYHGETSESKIKKVREAMKQKGGDVYVLSSIDDIAWLLNLRAIGAENSFDFYGFVAMTQTELILFVNQQTGDELEGITTKPYEAIWDYAKAKAGETVLFCPARTSYTLASVFTGKKITLPQDITTNLKARKNLVEIENLRLANEKEAVAFTKLMKQVKTNPTLGTEYDVVQRLEKIRKGLEGYHTWSFSPIAGYAENGAIVHYRVDPKAAKTIEKEGLLLVDSGAVYQEGTTDITRTFVLGNVTEEMKQAYTAVLRGNIALSMAKFPKGTCGYHLDAFARMPLWQMGLNFGHGTGHGIGHMLNVHEGPQNISPKAVEVPLEEGMVLSNEPGLYKTGAYGIRLENTIVVQKDETTDFGQFYTFETVSYIPFDKDAIVVEALTSEELKWLNAYHATTYEKVSPYLCEEGKTWLKDVTAALSV